MLDDVENKLGLSVGDTVSCDAESFVIQFVHTPSTHVQVSEGPTNTTPFGIVLPKASQVTSSGRLLGEEVKEFVGLNVLLLLLGDVLGDSLGKPLDDNEGEPVGFDVMALLGNKLDDLLGGLLDSTVGELVGFTVLLVLLGDALGDDVVGELLGNKVGEPVGFNVVASLGVTLGNALGDAFGTALGEGVGNEL